MARTVRRLSSETLRVGSFTKRCARRTVLRYGLALELSAGQVRKPKGM